jgi:hypothetical protein
MHDLSRRQYGEWGVREALTAYSGLSVVPDNGYGLLIAGTLAFRAEPKGHEIIADSYEVEIRVPGDFPHGAPIVKERGHRIPAGFHTYTDGTLCLGSPVRLQLTLSRVRPCWASCITALCRTYTGILTSSVMASCHSVNWPMGRKASGMIMQSCSESPAAKLSWQ